MWPHWSPPIPTCNSQAELRAGRRWGLRFNLPPPSAHFLTYIHTAHKSPYFLPLQMLIQHPLRATRHQGRLCGGCLLLGHPFQPPHLEGLIWAEVQCQAG